MQILYIRTSNIYDDSRATKEIFALAEKGHKVHVLGWDEMEMQKNNHAKCLLNTMDW